jgi:isoquinoline 1-oxidoreductase alpha subunit
MTLTINGERRTVEVAPETPLLWVLRDTLGLTGTKYGCGIGACGSCTVHVDGAATRSCQVAAGSLGSRRVTTIEGLSRDGSHPIQRAWLAEEVSQCGFCQPGQIMTAAALLTTTARPTDDEIDDAFADNVCRCGTYQRVRRAVHRAAREAKR